MMSTGGAPCHPPSDPRPSTSPPEILAMMASPASPISVCRRTPIPRWIGPATVVWRTIRTPLFVRLYEPRKVTGVLALGFQASVVGYFFEGLLRRQRREECPGRVPFQGHGMSQRLSDSNE